MDFTLTEAQHDLGGLARRILTDRAEAEPRPDPSGNDRSLLGHLGRAGLLDAALPQSVGGAGFGLLEQCSVLIEIGRTVAPVPYLSAIVTAAATIAEFGDGAHAERWVLPTLRGTATVAPALSEGAPAFTAAREGTSWRVHGSLTAVPDGVHAAAFLVEASTPDGSVLLVVPADSPGVTVSGQHVVDRTDAALLELDDVVVGAEAAIGAPDGEAAAWARRRALVGLCAWQLGIVERALELTAEYARSRHQFDKPIGSFQAVRQRLADAYLDVEAVRLTLWQAAWRVAEGLPADQEIATAKFWAAEAGHRVGHTAVHVHGGVGIDTDGPLHRYFVAAERAEFSLGGATTHLLSLGRHLAEEPA